MPLTRQDALRLLHFCLGPDDSGSVDLADDGAALVTVAPAEAPAGGAGVRTFEAATFDAALRQAVDAGMLKGACVEKQIAFLSKDGAREARSRDGAREAARDARADADAAAAARFCSPASSPRWPRCCTRSRSSAGCRPSAPLRRGATSGASWPASASAPTPNAIG